MSTEHAHDHRDPHTHAHHRPLSEILKIIGAAALMQAVKERASGAFQLLGEAEAAIHAIPVEQVHFHEVGAVDTIVDIVCAAAGAAALKVDRWIATPLNVGSGTVQCAHGTLPVPAPATLALLGDAPIYSAGPAMERVTPTGAADSAHAQCGICGAAGDAHAGGGIRRRRAGNCRASRTWCDSLWVKRRAGPKQRSPSRCWKR